MTVFLDLKGRTPCRDNPDRRLLFWRSSHCSIHSALVLLPFLLATLRMPFTTHFPSFYTNLNGRMMYLPVQIKPFLTALHLDIPFSATSPPSPV